MVHTTFPSEVLRRYLRYGALGRAERLIDKLSLGQLSTFVGDLTPVEARGLFDILFTGDRAERTLAQSSREDLAALLGHIDDERLTDVLAGLTGAQAAHLMALVTPRRRTVLRQLLQARARAFTLTIRPISALMTPPRAVAVAGTPVARVLEMLEAGRPEVLYVVERSQKLLGQVDLAQLEAAPPSSLIETLVVPVLHALSPSTPARDALPVLLDDGSATLPVVNPRGRLVGEVGVEAVRAVVPEDAAGAPVKAARATGWRRLLPWFAGTCLLAAGSASWALGVVHF